MQKLILAYNFTAERLRELKLVCMLLKVQLRAVPREDLLQPVGALAGAAGAERIDGQYGGSEAQEEMLVLCGLNRPELDRLLAAVKRGRLRQVALKAVLTPSNAGWSGLKLQQELSREHAYMHGRQSPRPDHAG